MNWKPEASRNQSSHGEIMTSEASNSSGEELQEADESQSFIHEDKGRDPINVVSPNADRNGNSKGQINQKNKVKTEYCGTHTRKPQEKGDLTNNNFEFDQEKSTVTIKSPKKDSNKEASKNKNIKNFQSEMDSSKDYSRDENKTMPKVVTDFIEEVSNSKSIVHSPKKPSKNTDIANFQSISVSLKENSICKGTVSSQAVFVESGENKQAVWDSTENSSKNKIQPVGINDKKSDILQSATKRSSSDNLKKLQEMNQCSSYYENFVSDENVTAKGYDAADEDLPAYEEVTEDNDLQVNENVAQDKSIATSGIVVEHSFPDKEKELQGINKCELEKENFAVDENIEAYDNIATSESAAAAAAGTVAEHSSPDSDIELQEINKCKLYKEIIESDKNVAEDKSNRSEKEQQILSENRSPFPNSCSVPDIANTVPNDLNTDFEVLSISEFSGKNSAEEKLLESNTCLIPIIPLSSNSESVNNTTELEPKQDCTALDVFGPVSTVSNSIPETSVFLTNEDSSKQSREIIYSVKANPFKEKSLIPKSLITFSIPHSSNSDALVEMKQLTPLQQMKSNQSIYKLAYNESLTSSETNSRSLSPVDPESQVPTSIVNDEIIVHEADTDSDAGSEDVELIPHRYECETSLNKNKNVYVNKLSLAVELLRTQESLPYDEHFKRVVEDNDPSAEDTVGEVNFGFEEDFNTSKSQGREVVVTSTAQSNNSHVNSGASSSVVNDYGFNDSCEEAEEMTVGTSPRNKDATKEVKATNRRYQVQLRHYFSSSAMTNPCLCCVIM